MTKCKINPTYAIRLRERGQITIPQAIRDKWSENEDSPNILNLTEIGDAVLLTPKKLLLPELSKQFSALMDEENVTLADLLTGLADEREALYRERLI